MVKKVTLWSVLGSLWTVFYLSLVVIVTIPDYPRHGDLWWTLTTDPNGYFHELWYLTIGYLSGIAVLMVVSFWWHAVKFLDAMSKVIIVPDGQPVRIIVRKRVRDAPDKSVQRVERERSEVPSDSDFRESGDRARLLQWYGHH